MVRHVILWKLKEEYGAERKEEIKRGIREQLEALNGKIPGMVRLTIVTEGLSSSNADVMLDSVFTDGAALSGYAVHPDHVKAADTFVRPFVALRLCMDFPSD
ncbi:MAG: Dabb family protein [Clostridia bacterium]|nr:Dabb family protein [Clostridia bacterium]